MRGFATVLAVALVSLAVATPAIAAGVAIVTVPVTAGVILAAALTDHRAPIVQPLEPFGPDPHEAAPTVETPDVTELLREIGSGQADLPPRITAQLRDIAVGRLLDGHRIDVDDPADRPRAGSLMSDALAAIVLDRRTRSDGRPAGRSDARSGVSKRQLGALLDELERL